MTEQETELSGGNVNTVVRIGDTVRRSTTPSSATVHHLLRHLEKKGFSGSPRVLGIDEQGRAMLSYIAGETGIPASIWQQDEPLVAAAALLRRYHDATVDFVPPATARWAHAHPDPARHQVICHNDFAPYNMIFAAGIPTAIIDFDLAGPGPRLHDVAYAAYWMTPLSVNSADQTAFSRADLADGSRRLRLFCHTYGIPVTRGLFAMMTRILERMASYGQMQALVGADAARKLKLDGHLDHWQAELRAFRRIRPRLEATIAARESMDSTRKGSDRNV